MYRFPWYLTLVSTNHASSNPGQTSFFYKIGLFCLGQFGSSLVYPTKKFHAATAKKSDRKASVIVHEQSVQSNVLLVKTHCLNFLTLLKLSKETNYSIAYKKSFSRLACSLYTDVVLIFLFDNRRENRGAVTEAARVQAFKWRPLELRTSTAG